MVKQNRTLGTTGLIDKQDLIPKIILNLARKRRQVVYGARSIQAQNRLFARDTQDYDIFDRSPKKSAKIVQKQLDKAVGFDYFFSKPAEHAGTWKVKGKGNDLKSNTEDDGSINKPNKNILEFSFIPVEEDSERLSFDDIFRRFLR